MEDTSSDKKLLRGQKEKSAVLTFGRFQPPTVGHQKLVDKVLSVSKKLGADAFVFPSRSQDKNKNPLSPKDKVKWMKKFFPKANIVNDDSVKTIFDAIKSLTAKGYSNITVVVGSDRVPEFKKTLTPYLKHDDPTKSLNVDTFNVVSAGERDPDATGVKGMSASKMRDAAKRNSFNEFLDGIPSNISDRFASELFDLLRKEMGLREDVEVPRDSIKTVMVVSNSNRNDTTKKILDVAEEMGHRPVFIKSNTAYLGEYKDGQITIENIDGAGKDVTIDPKNTIAFIRGSARKTSSGKALVEGLDEYDMNMVNRPDAMNLADNKYATYIAFDKKKIDTPKTALITNEASIPRSLEKIGKKFPVIVKTLYGAEGIGVVKVDSEDSFKSVVQSLRKSGQDILVQEMIDIDGDIRTIVFEGKILGAIKRKKVEGDFRTNKALGAKSVPYRLSEREKNFVLKIAESSGASYVGVDHAVSGGKLYAIEVNTSPGSGAEQYMNYENNKPVEGENRYINGKQLVEKMLTCAVEMKPQVRALSMGKIEKVMVEDQIVKARVDSGNSSHSVIDARGLKIEGDMAKFTFNGKNYKKKIVERVKIHVGSGLVETRPVVEMSFKVAGKTFKEAKFSLADRSKNIYPVLLGNRFMEENNVVVHTNKLFMHDMEHDVKRDIAKDFTDRYKEKKQEEYSISDLEGRPETTEKRKRMTPGQMNEIASEFFS
jgi:RimK family alpha-L-glutamate ligase